MAEVSLMTIAELLGHEDLTMVQRYAHLSQKHLRDSTRRLVPDPTPWTANAAHCQAGAPDAEGKLPIAA